MKLLHFHRKLPLSFNLTASDLIENMLISAIVTVLMTRGFLKLTGYPELGGQNLHIAHVLWGGFLMFIAVIMLVTFLNREAKYLAMLIAGIGFGLFVDELGKFLTRDNNYFFQPTIALVYMIFASVIVFMRLLTERITLTATDYAINALEIMKDAVRNSLGHSDRRRALAYLNKLDQKERYIKDMIDMFTRITPRQEAHISEITRFKDRLEKLYVKFVTQEYILALLVGIYVIVLIAQGYYIIGHKISSGIDFWSIGGFISYALVILLTLSSVFALISHKTKTSRRHIRISVLINILFVQFFLFYYIQFLALISLCISASVYTILQTMRRTRW